MYNEDEYFVKRNRENLVDFYKEELKKIDKDRKCKELLTRHAKCRMTKYGIIKKKRGKHIILTELGKELLKPHLSTPPLTRD